MLKNISLTSGSKIMKRSLAFLFILVSLTITSVKARAKMKKYLWLQELKPCEIESNRPYINGSFKYTGQGGFYSNVDGYTPWKIDHLYLFLEMKKCPTKLITDDCETMMSFPAGDQCDEKEAFFNHLYTQFKPPVVCPLNGLYEARNAVLDSDKYSQFFRGLQDEEWLHTYIHVYSDEKRLKKEICFIIIATMKKIRVQDKGPRKRSQ